MAENTASAAGKGGASDEDERLVSFTVPSWVVDGREMSPQAFACWVRIAAAQYRYGRSEISLETAATIAGMSQAEFLRVLKEAKQDTVVIDWDDFDRELAEFARRSGALSSQ